MWYTTCICFVVRLWAVNLEFVLLQLSVVLGRGGGVYTALGGGICCVGKLLSKVIVIDTIYFH